MSLTEDNSETGIFEKLGAVQEQKINKEHFNPLAEESNITELIEGPSKGEILYVNAASSNSHPSKNNSSDVDDVR